MILLPAVGMPVQRASERLELRKREGALAVGHAVIGGRCRDVSFPPDTTAAA